MAFTYREGLGRPLTYQEMDDNLEYVEELAQGAEGSASAAANQAALAESAAGQASDKAGEAEGHEQQAQMYAAAAQAAAGIPALAGNAGKVLGVESGEQGVEWKQLGTAATRDVGTSPGNLLEVGSFGLGGQGTTYDYSDNEGNSLGGGFFIDGSHSTIVSRRSPQTGVEFSGAYQGDSFYARRFRVNDGGWQPRVELYHSGNWYLGTDKQHTTNATGAVTLNLASASIFDLTLTGNVTLSVSNASVPAGEARSIVVRIRQGATARTLTWWSGITWLHPSTPPAPPAGKIVEYVLSFDGSSWIGRVGASS